MEEPAAEHPEADRGRIQGSEETGKRVIAEQLQKMVLAYLIASYTASGWDVDPLTDGGYNVSNGATQLRFTRGETTEEKTLPLIMVEAEDGQEDYETGNEFITLSVSVVVASEDAGAYTLLKEQTDTVKELLWFDRTSELQDAINAATSETFECLIMGTTDRTVESSFDDRARVNKLSLRLYCAGLENA
jgi:hypothetical protein